MRACFAASLIAAVILAGCSGQPGDMASPTAGPSATQQVTANDAFMPVSPGNHWTYDRTFTIQIIPDDGPPSPPETFTDKIDVDHVEYRSIGAREYVVEHEIFREGGGNEYLRRQDRAGYYMFDRGKDEGKDADGPTLSSGMRADAPRARVQHMRAMRVARATGASVASIEAHFARVDEVHRLLRGLDATPDAGPPGGPLVNELTVLEYPLHPDASWLFRETPEFSATVEARERLNGFSAWRVRIDSEFFEAEDTVHIWYSRCGEVGRRLHLTSLAVGPDGTPIGTAISDDIIDVVEVDIDRGGCDLR